MRQPLAPDTKKKVEKQLAQNKKLLADIQKQMRPPISKRQLKELKSLELTTRANIAEYKDWLANGGIPILPPLLWHRYKFGR